MNNEKKLENYPDQAPKQEKIISPDDQESQVVLATKKTEENIAGLKNDLSHTNVKDFFKAMGSDVAEIFKDLINTPAAVISAAGGAGKFYLDLITGKEQLDFGDADKKRAEEPSEPPSIDFETGIATAVVTSHIMRKGISAPYSTNEKIIFATSLGQALAKLIK